MRAFFGLFLSAVAGLMACETAPGESGCPDGDCGDNSCASDEYRSGGDCHAVTQCSSSQYEVLAPNATRDRMCKALTTCRDTQFESRPPSARADRVCRTLTECRASQFEAQAPTDTTDRLCRALTTCGRDEYQAQEPTDTSDRVCAKLTTCDGTEYEAKAPTETSDRVCEPQLACPPQSYQAAPGSATSAPWCRPLTECKSNEYELQPPTATSDRVCSRITECAGYEQELAPPTETSDRVCGEAGPCEPGFYESEPATATREHECKRITTCTALQYELQAPTATSNRVCADITRCRDNEYQTAPPTATSNRVCALTTVCTADQYESVAPTATTDRQCAWLTECSEGQAEQTPPTPTSDRVCCGDYDDDGICDAIDDACDVALPGATTVEVNDECIVPDVIVDDPWNIVEEAFIPTVTAAGSTNMPVIANLDDDNGDGVIDDRDTPELLYTEIGALFGGSLANALVARRSDGTNLFRRTDVDPVSTPLVADIDQDGEPEIVHRLATGELIALSADGQTIEWTTSFTTGSIYGVTPTVADINGDGDLEVIVAGGGFLSTNTVVVVDGSTGVLEWTAETATQISLPVTADLDRDGASEIIFGGLMFSGDGSVLWDDNVTAFVRFNVIVNVDLDNDGEVLSVGEGVVTVVDADGQWMDAWEYPLPFIFGETQAAPGPPCVADFDGDGGPEIAIPAGSILQVFELDGEPVWDDNATIADYSGIAGCSGYDVDGDGAYEVLFADENTFWIFDGRTGAVNFSESAHSSGTLWEYPTVADFDKDGSAEVFIASNNILGGDDNETRSGIVIFGHVDNGWARAGSTWAIHDYAPGKIGADNTVNLDGPQPWEVHNVYRARPTVETAATDLRVEYYSGCASSCLYDGTIELSFVVTNHGQTASPIGVVVALYNADYWTGDDVLLGTVTLDEAVVSGGSVSGSFTTSFADLWSNDFVLEVDPDGLVGECNSSNNEDWFSFWECSE